MIQQPASADNSPHVFTIFRTTNSAMSISFMARDSAGRTIADQSGGLNLQPVTPGSYGRRLTNDTKRKGSLEVISERSKSQDFLTSAPRRLSSRRRSFSSDSRRRSYTDSRRRTSVSSPRRRSMISDRRRTISDPRRRTVDSYRRRATTITDYRRRSSFSSERRRSTWSSQSYSNPANPNFGNYGYANQNYAYHNYGGHMPMTTPYGYSGANAYQGGSGSGMKIALAGGAGLLAGIAANKMMHHWGGYSRDQIMNSQCSSGGCGDFPFIV